MLSLSADTQAVLLLCAPLITGESQPSTDPLSNREYQAVTRLLAREGLRPANLLETSEASHPADLKALVDSDRLHRLLGRGFQLAQAVERWSARLLWVVSQFDTEYPARILERVKEQAPVLLYGCGERSILDSGGLGIVGSRNVDNSLLKDTEFLGSLAAQAGITVVSGGARGVDRAAMLGALDNGGRVIGVLVDNLERAAMNREHRQFLMDGRLVLLSPYDPLAGFNVGHAMQRNKLIYALADAAVVMNSDVEKGGTWAGASEQLEKLRFVPVYVRSEEGGCGALRRKGAQLFPNITTPEDLAELLSNASQSAGASDRQLSLLS